MLNDSSTYRYFQTDEHVCLTAFFFFFFSSKCLSKLSSYTGFHSSLLNEAAYQFQNRFSLSVSQEESEERLTCDSNFISILLLAFFYKPV